VIAMKACPCTFKGTQQGVSAVEFALVLVILLALLFGIVEFGRLFFTINSVQEITRRAAREQVVNRPAKMAAVQHVAVLNLEGCGPDTGTLNFRDACSSGTVNFPGSPDITNVNVELGFFHSYGDARQNTNALPDTITPEQNIENCVSPENTNCIKFVRASLIKTPGQKLDFGVIAPYLPLDLVTIGKSSNKLYIPFSTVIMPAEALGLL
jgi:Flp pilus assembly protein TadG